MLLLEENIIKRGQIEETIARLEFGSSNGKHYEIETIYDSTVYARELEDHLAGLHYLVSWKGYSKEGNT